MCINIDYEGKSKIVVVESVHIPVGAWSLYFQHYCLHTDNHKKDSCTCHHTYLGSHNYDSQGNMDDEESVQSLNAM